MFEHPLTNRLSGSISPDEKLFICGPWPIPGKPRMFGIKHSLNVSVTAGIVIWEVAKQFLERLKL
jgi:hypothetical protein